MNFEMWERNWRYIKERRPFTHPPCDMMKMGGFPKCHVGTTEAWPERMLLANLEGSCGTMVWGLKAVRSVP